MKKENSYPRFISNKPCGIDKFEGKSQERLTNAIANHIVSIDKNKTIKDLSRIIGLEGGWGVGKSNVIKQLNKHDDIRDNYYLFEYDAWGHQEDLQRRSFLEILTAKLIDDEILSGNTKISIKGAETEVISWSQKLKYLLARKTENEIKKRPKLGIGVVAFVLATIFTSIFTSIADALKECCLVLSIILPFIPFAIATIIVLRVLRKKGKRGKEIFNEILSIYNGKIENEVTYEIISEEEPSVTEFKKWMQDISDHSNKKLIIVYDNMDRLPAEKVKQLWSSIHTFFSEDGFENIWVIIPFDEKHLSCAFGEMKDEKEQLTRSFISKTFPIVYRVTPPVITTDFKNIFDQLFVEAFDDTEDEQQYEINRIFRLEKPDATVRDIIEYINQLVALKNIWLDEIDILYIAIFVLRKDKILSNKELKEDEELSNNHLAERILSGSYLGEYISQIVQNDEDLQINIAALSYGVSKDKAAEIPMSKYIDGCFALDKNRDINKFTNSKNFIPILGDKVANADNVLTDSIIKSLSLLNTESFSESDKGKITSLWNRLAYKKMKSLPEKQEFSTPFQILPLHTNLMVQRKLLQYLCINIQQFDSNKFSGESYFIALNAMKDFIEKHNIEFDITGELQEKTTDPKTFLHYVIKAKENYHLFKLNTDPDKLDEYLVTLFPEEDVWRQTIPSENQNSITDYSHSYIVDSLTNLCKDKSYKFDKFLNQVKQHLPDAEAREFKPYLDVYKILADEKPLEVQLSSTQLQNIWSTYSASFNTPEYLESITIWIANGKGSGVDNNNDLSDEQIKYIAENLDYYADYGDLLIENLSWSIPLLSQVLKYMTENKLGHRLSLAEVLSKFFEIKNGIGVSESTLLGQLNQWEDYEDTIDASNISQVLSDAQFFEFSKVTKNTLTDYLNTTVVEALSEIQVDQLYAFIKQPTQYWTIVTDNLIGTDFIRALPDNLTEVGKRFMDEIATKQLAIPAQGTIIYKLIENLDRRKTSALIKDIRDKYCNSQSNITPQLFIFFEEWFENQGKLKDVADRTTHKIIEPVINDSTCLDIIISKSDYYADIINSAGDDATALKDVIKMKIQNSPEENLISFAKKIGIEPERENKSKDKRK
ncbi:MAG TPA: hypothetical protein DD434_10650 [Bacteroidales bacterium]|jgi:hypothetical protein|nr:hypothetical protein [Bacteroidales bacterium]